VTRVTGQSFTAKAARAAEEKKSFTAEAAKVAKVYRFYSEI